MHYLGPRSLEGLVREIEACDVGIIPNHRSAFAEINTPTRIFEYLALGKPVIAPRAAGISDYFDDGSLVFFELGNAEDLARKDRVRVLPPCRGHRDSKTRTRGLSRTSLANREAAAHGSGHRPPLRRTWPSRFHESSTPHGTRHDWSLAKARIATQANYQDLIQ